MNWFADLKIKTKLLVSFLLVALIAGLMGYEGISSLKSVDESDTILYQTNAYPLGTFGDLTSYFQRMRGNGLELLLAQSDAESQTIISTINNRLKDIQNSTDILDKINLPEESRNALSKAEMQLKEFEGLFLNYIQIIKENRKQDALVYWNGQLNSSRQKVQAALGNLNTVLTRRAKARADKNSAEAASSISFMTIFMILGVLVSMGLGYYISRLISKPVAELLSATNKFADGDLNVTLHNESKDEIGELTSSFRKMIEKITLQIQYLDNLPNPVMITDKEFNIQYINNTGANLVSKNQKQLIGQKCYDQYKTEHCQTENCALQKAMQCDCTITAETKANPSGKSIPIMYTGSPIKDRNGKIIGAMEAIADISDIKAIQNYLTRSTQNMLNAMEKFADGDLTVKVQPEKDDDDIGKLFLGFNRSINNIRNIIEKVNEAVEATASAANQISSSSEEMAAGAQEQSSQAQEVASAIEQMTRTILETTRNAGTTAEQAKHAGDTAAQGGTVVSQTIEGMNKIANVVTSSAETVQQLGKSSDQIGEIIQVIDDIADQTNLLALNAAIEAARAGEQGRGFAVVADEVRKLAERTTKATKEIADMIKKIQKETVGAVNSMNLGAEEVQHGKELAAKAGTSLQEIISGSQSVVDKALQVSAASEEQSSAAEQISKNIEGITSVTQQTAAGVQQIARAAEDLNRLTANLESLVSSFKIRSEGISDKKDFGIGKSYVRTNGSIESIY